MNVGRLSAEQLQALVQHKSFATTETYTKLARDLNPALQKLFVSQLPETQPAERKANGRWRESRSAGRRFGGNVGRKGRNR
jgi:hypothetical protein